MTILPYLQLSRPKQWTKNIFVLAPLFFSKHLFEWDRTEAALQAFIAFCLMASAVYVLNDLVDVEKDRLHPKKKNRPLAAGRMSKWSAVIYGVAIYLVALWIGLQLNPTVLWFLLLYFFMNLLYSFWLKNVVLVDIFIIAFGFVIRVLVGVWAIQVIPSPWLLLCTFLLALFLGLCKRRAEIIVLQDSAGSHRKILNEYNERLLDQLISLVASATIMAYSLYTFNSTPSNLMMITIPFVLFAIFRYLYLVYTKKSGGEPSSILLGDGLFLSSTLLWGMMSMVIVHFS